MWSCLISIILIRPLVVPWTHQIPSGYVNHRDGLTGLPLQLNLMTGPMTGPMTIDHSFFSMLHGLKAIIFDIKRKGRNCIISHYPMMNIFVNIQGKTLNMRTMPPKKHNGFPKFRFEKRWSRISGWAPAIHPAPLGWNPTKFPGLPSVSTGDSDFALPQDHSAKLDPFIIQLSNDGIFSPFEPSIWGYPHDETSTYSGISRNWVFAKIGVPLSRCMIYNGKSH